VMAQPEPTARCLCRFFTSRPKVNHWPTAQVSPAALNTTQLLSERFYPPLDKQKAYRADFGLSYPTRRSVSWAYIYAGKTPARSCCECLNLPHDDDVIFLIQFFYPFAVFRPCIMHTRKIARQG
jgi:hypothetical protein